MNYFLLENYSKDKPLKINKVNNRTILTVSDGELVYKGQENNSPVNFAYVKSDSNQIFKKSDLVETRLFKMELIYEKPDVVKDEVKFDDFIKDFGDKKSKDWLKKRDITKTYKYQTIKFASMNQLLPEFNSNAKTPADAYNLKLMFNSDEIMKFNLIEIKKEDLDKYFELIEINDMFLLAVLDCLYRILDLKQVFKNDIPERYNFFFENIKGDVVRNKLTHIAKDRLLIKFYIILFMAVDYRLDFNKIPRFGLSRARVIKLLRTIGCTIQRNDKVVLDKMPDTFLN
ncbi:hypothetical protein HERIO_1886 [Hepatospora eriocheir]|uniref:RPA49 n=2 Tax=Hepatospora eriocheir TaxID=1081669 RepID=A0A1X0Q8N9_9MICR|nr:hypothetical protein HERIO_1886 [Hepatospora eriocheir]